MLIQSFIGLALTLGGVFVMFLFMMSLDTRTNIFFLIGSVLAMGGGVFLLIRAGKDDTIILKRTSKEGSEEAFHPEPVDISKTDNEGMEKQLSQNNKLLDEWKKTKETQQRLKLLEMQASASDE